MGRMSDKQAATVAMIERNEGQARIIPPGPRRDGYIAAFGADAYETDVLVALEDFGAVLVARSGAVIGEVYVDGSRGAADETYNAED